MEESEQEQQEQQSTVIRWSSGDAKRLLVRGEAPADMYVEGGLYIIQETITLPNRLSVSGDLGLNSCFNLNSLGDGLKVDGSVHIFNCSLTSLGDCLSVGGDIEIFASSGPTELGDDISVGGSFDPNGCSALTSLGDRLKVGKYLDLSDCAALTSLGDGLSVGGTLDLGGCLALQEQHRGNMGAFFEQISAALGPKAGLSLRGWDAVTELPNGFSVGGTLKLTGCSALTSLGDGLGVGGGLYLGGCSALQQQHRGNMGAFFEQISAALGPKAWLSLDGWDAVTELPNGFRVAGTLDLSGCSALTSLGDGLGVGGGLFLSGCSALQEQHRGNMGAFFEQISATLGPKAWLSLAGWDAVTELPNGFSVGGGLLLQDCSALTSLGNGLSVEGKLGLSGCSALTSLGNELSVGGELGLSGCSALTSLGNGLSVGGELGLSGCSALTSLGNELSVSGHLNLQGCSALASLGNGLSVSGHLNLQGCSALTSLGNGLSVSGHLNLQGCSALASLGNGLSEFGISEPRKALATRVIDVLVLLNEDVLVREEIVTRMADSLDTCGDKPVWALNQMTLVVEVAKARGDRSKLEALGRRVMRLMVVHKHVERKIKSLSFVDDVCVYLRFEIDLREALDLPVAATAMIYPSYINIEDAELEAAKDDALAITDAQFEAWLAEWPEWQRQLRREVAEHIVCSSSSSSSSSSDGGWSLLEVVEPQQGQPLSELLNLTGEKMDDPVTLDSGRSTWSLGDLLRHWERTGLDLQNSPVSAEQLRSALRRVVARSDQ